MPDSREKKRKTRNALELFGQNIKCPSIVRARDFRKIAGFKGKEKKNIKCPSIVRARVFRTIAGFEGKEKKNTKCP